MRPKIVQLELNDLPDSHTATEKYIADLEEIVNAVLILVSIWVMENIKCFQQITMLEKQENL